MSDANIFAGTTEGNVYLSSDNGRSWTVLSYLPNMSALIFAFTTAPQSLAVYDGTIFAGACSGIFISTGNGASWTAVDFVPPKNNARLPPPPLTSLVTHFRGKSEKT